MRRAFVFLFLAVLMVTMPASAQDKRADVNIGGGYTASLSTIKDYLGNGYNFNLGVTFWASPAIGIQAEYGFNGLGQKHIVDLPVSGTPGGGGAVQQPFYGDMNMQYGDFNLVVRPAVQGRAHPYLVAGLGIYYRPMKITTPGVGYVPGFCSPYWYYCVPGGYVPVENVVGSRSETDMGMDVGGGVNVKLGESAAFYVEARYHYIWGKEIKDAAGTSYGKANGQFLPITFGFRF